MRAGSAALRRGAFGLLCIGLVSGACEPLDIAVFPSTPDAGRPIPVDVSPPPPAAVLDAGTPPDAGSVPVTVESPPLPCLPGATACEACVRANSCPISRVCHPYTGDCVLPCSAGNECPAPSVCNQLVGVCVACIDERQCTTSGAPLCDTTSGVCVECRSSEDCPDSLDRPACLPDSRRCGCDSDDDCPMGRCETREGHCELDD